MANDRFRGKVAVITGAASGIGLGLAMRAAREGMRVALADIEPQPLQEALAQVGAGGAEVIAIPTDVSDAAAVDRMAAQVRAELGEPWLVCNNAGVNKFKPVWALTPREWQWIVGVNLWGVIHGIATFAPRMIELDDGHIVNTASAAGFTVTPGASAYVATKHAVVGLSEGLYRELQVIGSSVGVSVVCPRLVATNMLTATRNEPGAQGPSPAPVDMTAFSAKGMLLLTPDELAEQVFSAIDRRRFWVLSHAAEMRNIVTERVRQALDGINPNDDSVDPRSAANGARQAGLAAN